jgi:hypothetical protein
VGFGLLLADLLGADGPKEGERRKCESFVHRD